MPSGAPVSADHPTQTRDPGPTPGPGHPNRRTLSDDTERIGPDELPNQRFPQIPGYRIDRVLGRGGMGVVYRAVQLAMNRVVALKVIYPRGADDTHARGRFDREILSLARIEHPNVVPVHHAGDWHGFPYLTMKFVPGGALSQHLARFRGRPEACARLVAKVARAVQALHDANILHRDLKPLNVLLGDEDEPLVADFGLAKWLDDSDTDHTRTGAAVGTRQYMAPEQTLGARASYTRACDVWAIGVTLYELLAGERPFKADGDGDLAELIRTAEPPPLVYAPPALVSVVRNCLAKEPEARYPTAAAVADDLDRYLAGERVKDPPPTPRPRRRWWPAAVAAVAAVGLFAGMLAFPRPEHNPPPPQPPPTTADPADELRAGRTVEFIGATGRPKVLDMPGGHVGTLDINKDGLCEVGTAAYALIELFKGPIPVPVRFEAEVAMVAGNSPAEFGVYLGRRHLPGPDRGYQAFFFASFTGPWINPKDDVPAQAMLGARLLRPERRGVDPSYRSPLGVPVRFFHPPQPNPDRDWRRLAVTIDPRHLEADLFETRHGPVAMDHALASLNRVAAEVPAAGRPALAAPSGGDGLGLFVFAGKAVFRNVRLVPTTGGNKT